MTRLRVCWSASPSCRARSLLPLLCVCYAQTGMAESLLFSFRAVPSSAAYSTRSLSKGELLIVTVAGMRPGEQLRLERCGNSRCSVSAPVAVWTFDSFEQYSPAEVPAQDDRYSFLLFSGNEDVVGTHATAERGVTTLRFSSGTVVTVTVCASDDRAGVTDSK